MTEHKYHPILEPGLYEVVYFGLHPMLGQHRDAYLDISLKQGDTIRRLRFLAPVEVEINVDFNGQVWVHVLDISDRQLDHIRVEFGKFEMNSAISFKAYDVIDLDERGDKLSDTL